MSGLNLEPFLRLLRADVGAWTTLGVIVVLLGLLAWTSWGSRKVLRKCLVLSVLVHVGLAFYSKAHPTLLLGAGNSGSAGDQTGIQEIRVQPVPTSDGAGGLEPNGSEGPTAEDGQSAGSMAEWDRLGSAVATLDDPDLRTVSPPDPMRADRDRQQPAADRQRSGPEPPRLSETAPEIAPTLPEPTEAPPDSDRLPEPDTAETSANDLTAVAPPIRNAADADTEGEQPALPENDRRMVLPEPTEMDDRPDRQQQADRQGLALNDPDAPQFRPELPDLASEADEPARPEAPNHQPVENPNPTEPAETAVPPPNRFAAGSAEDSNLPVPDDRSAIRQQSRPEPSANTSDTETLEKSDRERPDALAAVALPPVANDPQSDAEPNVSAIAPENRDDAKPSPNDRPPAQASDGDPEAVADARQSTPETSEPATTALPEADLRSASRPALGGTGSGSDLDAILRPERSSGTDGPLLARRDRNLDLDRVVPDGFPALPDVRGSMGGRPLADVPEVYRPRLDPDRSQRAKRLGATDASQQAVERALSWLSRHQDADGRWDAGTARYSDGSAAKGQDSFTAHCPPGDICHGECYYWEADSAMTGLALLAFLGAGYTHTDGQYAQTIDRGLDYLRKIQKPNGDLRGQSRAVGIYCHAMAALALSEAYALTGDPKLRDPIERATTFLVEAQYPGLKGWRYAPSVEIERKPSEDGRRWVYEPHRPVGDTSVLGWVVMALKSASAVGVDVPSRATRGALNWLELVSDGEHGGLARYQPAREPDPVMSAEAWVCRQFLGVGGPGQTSDEAANYLIQHPPTQNDYNIYYWYYGTLAMYQHGGPAWNRWNNQVRDALIALQHQNGHKAGSWSPDPTRYGTHGGRIYTTALGALTLEVYYRYLRLYGPEGGAGAIKPFGGGNTP